ncbi:uncharacterized protein [Ptychodera flava]|uniref:uncharacterized protein n=1 Tax=Ptychodera flava TaxID=63121 RepID=UPI00396A3026
MISYNWEVQERMKEVKTKLQAAGYDVWMDIEKMAGDTLEAMARAVEGADVVLICMAEKYKNSNNCRMEAEYACKLKKPYIPLRVEKGYSPDGWLGIMVGTKLYFDLSSDEQFEKNFPGLVREISNREEPMDGVVEKSGITQPDMPVPKNIKVPLWGNTQIAEWLGRNGVGDFETKFKKFAGEDLLMLKKFATKRLNFLWFSDKGSWLR